MAALSLLLPFALASVAAAVAPLAVAPTRHAGALQVHHVKTTGKHPIDEVVTMLQDMLQTLDEEQQADEETYDKIAVWCETNDQEKTQAITDAEADITRLTAEIETQTASSAKLDTEMKVLDKEVAENKKALEEATALRKQQNDAFNAQHKDLIESTTAMKAAILVLQKHHSTFLQVPTTHMLSIATMLQKQLQSHAGLLQRALKPSQRKSLDAFVQTYSAQPDYFDATPTFKGAYAPQSGEIFGILSQMLEEFEADLAAAQQEESAAQSDYEALKTAKTSEISTGEAQIESKTIEKAAADEANVQAKNDLADTKASLSADEQFLMTVKERCQMTDTEWEQRQQTRQEEIKAVTKALEVLTADDADATFNRTYSPTFFQQASVSQSERREKASQLLASIAAKVNNPKLAALSATVKLDDFTEVKKAIDQMVADLLKEKDDEIKTRDYCTGDLHETQVQTERKEREKEDVEAHIGGLNSTISQLESEIAALNTEISDLEAELATAGENRDLENKEFQTTVADQQETQRLLKKAKEELALYYGKGGLPKSSLIQTRNVAANETAPEGFDDYENQGGISVMSLIEQLITDAAQMEADSVRAEDEAQSAYEDFVKDTRGSIAAKSKSVVQKSASKAAAEKELVAAEDNHDAIVSELQRLSNYDAEVHANCDFILKNFEVRQTARDEEIEALRQAKSILSGADLGL